MTQLQQPEVAILSGYNIQPTAAQLIHSSLNKLSLTHRSGFTILKFSMATNPIKKSPSSSETICASCKRRQVHEPDQQLDTAAVDSSDAAYNKKPRLEAMPLEPIDEPLVHPHIASVEEESHKDMSGEKGDKPHESAEDELRGCLFRPDSIPVLKMMASGRTTSEGMDVAYLRVF